MTRDLAHIKRMRILIADEAPTRLAAALSRAGFPNVTTARTAGKTLDQLRSREHSLHGTVDAVLIGVRLTDLDGAGLCRTLRAYREWRSIPIILVTDPAESAGETLHAADHAGADDVLFTPIRLSELFSRLLWALSLKQERDLRHRRERALMEELAERKIMEARLEFLLDHDALTGIANRRGLEQALEQAVLDARYQRRNAALLYLDLDQFKVINDTEGHDAGDRLLVEVVAVLRGQLRPSDLISRIGSDDFGVLLRDTDQVAARASAERLRHTLDQFAFATRARRYHISASIGVAMVESDRIVSTGQILGRADQACFIAKSSGRNRVHVYQADDRSTLHQLRSDAYWVPLIRDALANQGFQLMFQPVQDLRDGTINHYEVLLRMEGKRGELLSPTEFVTVAERMGLIGDIDRWVLNQATELLRTLPESISLHINLSGHAFVNPSLLTLVRQRLRETGVQAQRLTFEITETAAIADPGRTRQTMQRLRALGCRFALDDFGSGFNSYSHLKQFPVDMVKIDGAFVSNLISDPVDRVLVESMVAVAHTLGKQTVAEFVENQATLELLKQLGVDYAQGYFIGEPARELVVNG
ncbi:MAG: putative bifunctional diguanylate cyclase/phosphodiesterase [Gammaproteobacteria bacterium]|nr:EAL domain-containing protein [Gammaproteobacteria bacterium]